MKENSYAVTTLHDLLDYDAAKFNSAEVQLKKMLPVWIAITPSVKFKEALIRYHDFINKHLENMETFIAEEKMLSEFSVNRVMYAFIEELNEKINSCTDLEVKEACLLAGIQSINHYKISMYGTAAAFAKALGMEKAASTFHEAEVNEKQIDDRLSQLAEFEINAKARAPILITSQGK